MHVVIESAELSPEQITAIVGTEWDEAHRIGDPRGYIGKLWEHNVWRILSSRETADYPGQTAHDVAGSGSGEFGIHVTSRAAPGLSFDRSTVEFIADLDLSMDIDVILYSDED